MTVTEFLDAISDEHGPLRSTASDIISDMSAEEFEALMLRIRRMDNIIRMMIAGDQDGLMRALIEIPEIFS